MRAASVLLISTLLAACQAEHGDIQAFMKQADQTIVPKIDPLPLARPYEPFEYTGFDLPDPFRPRSLKEPTAKNVELAPDADRRKEALEAYPLDSLKFVGLLQQRSVPHALIRAEGVLHRIQVGNFMGQDYGEVIGISESELKIKERVQDGEGDWTIRESTLHLADQAESQENKK
jgi:type IV pilus assembly protein PilP